MSNTEKDEFRTNGTGAPSAKADPRMRSRVKKDRLGKRHQTQEQESQTEPDWEEIEKHLSDYPELAPYRERIQMEATAARMQRLLSEKNWAELKREWEKAPFKQELDQKLAIAATRQFHLAAVQQILESTGQGKKRGKALSVALLYNQLNPQDGIESALARAIAALPDTILECLRRGSISDASPVRDLELNHATKFALVLSALTKAFDGHRDRLYQPKKSK